MVVMHASTLERFAGLANRSGSTQEFEDVSVALPPAEGVFKLSVLRDPRSFSMPVQSGTASTTTSPAERLLVVAPGIAMSEAEYHERFAGIDLDALRGKMRPAVFRAFVMHVGAITASIESDANELLKDGDSR